MGKVVFIFGAGASAQAGAPTMNNFLDSAHDVLFRKLVNATEVREKDVREDFVTVFSVCSELQKLQYRTPLNLTNIESLFSIIEMGKILGRLGSWKDPERIERASRSVVNLIVRTLSETMSFDSPADPNFPAPYGVFSKIIADKAFIDNEFNNKVSFITFNYDLGLEYSLNMQGLGINYHLNGEELPGKFSVLKLHGSLNWLKCKNPLSPCNGEGHLFAVPIKDARFREIIEKDEKFLLLDSILDHKDCPKCQVKLPVPSLPFLVPPTWEKTSHYKEIINVWRKAVNDIAEADTIVVIGYSLPETDAFFKYLFALSSNPDTYFKRFIIVNPVDKIGKKFYELLGTGIKERFIHWEIENGYCDFEESLRNIKKLVASL